jgi:protein Mpv17
LIFRLIQGLCLKIVQGHVWYKYLDTVVSPENPSCSKAVVTKMLADQALWAPLNTILFYAYLALLEGNAEALPAILHDKLLPTVLAGYALWPLAHLVNFAFIPGEQRLLYVNFVNLFWTVYLSRMANADVVTFQVPGANILTPIPVSANPGPGPNLTA